MYELNYVKEIALCNINKQSLQLKANYIIETLQVFDSNLKFSRECISMFIVLFQWKNEEKIGLVFLCASYSDFLSFFSFLVVNTDFFLDMCLIYCLFRKHPLIYNVRNCNIAVNNGAKEICNLKQNLLFEVVSYRVMRW